MAKVKSVAIIGSFRQHYQEVEQTEDIFCQAGLEVTSPRGTCLDEQGKRFVRFRSDRREWSDEMLQVVSLHRILRADFVYAVAPGGYVGRATCYEVGRTIQANQPLYFSEKPRDIAITVPSSHVMTPEEVVARVTAGQFEPRAICANISGQVGDLERDLIEGRYCSL